MRQPTFSRRKTRQQRLLRTGIGVVVVVVVAALIANLAGGKKKSNTPPPGVAQVKFVASVKGASDGKTLQNCSGGVATFAAYCLAGCHVAPAGQNDSCNAGSCPSVRAA